jgi:TonB family protein
MKNFTLVFFLLLTVSGSIYAQNSEQKKKKVLYSLEQREEDEFWNSEMYPRPVMTDSDLIDFIRSRISYPELCRRNYSSSAFTIPLIIGTNGLSALPAEYMATDAFEQMAISILTDPKMTWIPASKNKKKKEMLIHVPVMFQLNFWQNKIYYYAAFFKGLHMFVIDSSENHTSFVIDTTLRRNFISEYYLMIPPVWEHNREYGTVTLGFEVDTTGHIADLKVVNSINPLLDNEALSFINKTNGAWTPAWKDGSKVPSYKYFNCYFNDAYFESTMKENEIKALRLGYKIIQDRGYKSNSSLAHHEYFYAMQLLQEKKYQESLYYFDRAARYFVKDPNVFYQRAIALHYCGKPEKSCDDLQRVVDIAEIEGFPAGITQQQVFILIDKFCQQ